jgi:hypothetical protein
MYANVKIDLTRPSGRKTLRELEAKKCVTIEIPNPGISGTWHKWEDVWDKIMKDASEHYRVDMQALVNKRIKE